MSSITARTHVIHSDLAPRRTETHASELTLRATIALIVLAFIVAVIGVVAWQPAVIITAGLMTAITVPFLVTAFVANLSAK